MTSRRMRTGGEIVADHLEANGVPYVVGIPGHGNLALVDAFVGRTSPRFLQVRHEQSAAHLADAYFRVARRPLAVMTSIGPGAVNTAVGIASAYVDSSSMLVFTGDVHTYMFGRGVLQEVDRKSWADLTSIFEPITKRLWQVSRVDQLPRILPQAYALATAGRPGPVLVSLPMDAQADAIEVEPPTPVALPRPPEPSEPSVRAVLDALTGARRPIILAGGGVAQDPDGPRLVRALAEELGIPVVATYPAKGILPETHPLYGWYPGSKGTDLGNTLCREADVILALGCRFADEAASSYVPGVTFSIPPTKLFHVDIDEYEIGKNYPVELGIVSDAAAFAARLLAAAADGPARAEQRVAAERRVAGLLAAWDAKTAPGRTDRTTPLRISSLLDVLRGALPPETIVVTSAGHPQAQFLQEFPVVEPLGSVSSNGFSTMGFTIPGALGAKLAAPSRPVVGFAGDGDFLMTVQELATAAQYRIPVVLVVADNGAWQSIRDLQLSVYGEGRSIAAEFRDGNGEGIAPDITAIARGFGVEAVRVEDEAGVGAAVSAALRRDGPTVIHVPVRRDFPASAGLTSGWWDVPIPASLTERRRTYEREVAPVRHDPIQTNDA